MAWDSHDEQMMKRALRLARRGEGRVEPNPMVGCVIARGELVLAEGRHRRFGGPHAEADALKRCSNPRGATAYVTLEPCAHHGKTPPCTEALIAAGVQRVVVAARDPHPAARGGVDRLRKAGVQVVEGVLEAQARELNAPFFRRVIDGRPWVIAKWAQTLDGRIATAAGDSRWISGTESRRLVHRTRSRVDAVLVAIGTVLQDDPRLTARQTPRRREAVPVVVDPFGAMPDDARLLERSRVVVAVDRLAEPIEKKWRRREHVRLVPLDRLDSGRLDLRPLLTVLAGELDMTNVLVEGGGKLIGSLFAQGLVDEAMVFIAPKLMADPRAAPAAVGLEPERIDQTLRMTLHSTRRLGDDVLLRYRLPPPAAQPRGA